MALKQTYITPRGDRVELTAETAHLLEDIQKGDGTLGYSGDPRLYVVWSDPVPGQYNLLRHCEDGQVRHIKAFPPHEFRRDVVLVYLANNDLRSRRGLMDDLDKQWDDLVKNAERAKQDLNAELSDRWNFAVRQYSDSGDGLDTPVYS